MTRNLRLAWIAAIAACAAPAAPGSTPKAGPVQQLLSSAADEAGVPEDLVVAIAVEEGGVKLPMLRVIDPTDNVPVAGMLELRHGRLDTLSLGAQLVGATPDALRGDTALGTRAGARVLATLGAEHGAAGTLASWRPALEVMSGLDDVSASRYASRVLALLRTGGDFPARGGELVHIAAHPEIDLADTVDQTPRFQPYAQTPDYPGAIWFTTSCTNKCTVGRPLGNSSVNKIVIHDTEGGWDASVSTLEYDSGKSVHYIVDADGSRVGQFRHETDTTWHAGNYYYNETSVGIEHVGVASNPSGYSDGLYEKSVDLVKSIRTRWNVPLDRKHIIGHYQIPDGTVIAEDSAPCTDTLDNCETSSKYGGADNHRDPGYYWQWCQYMERLGGHCTCNDAWPLWNCTTDHTEAWRCNNGTVEEQMCTGPMGCTVMPIGQNDVCDTSDPAGSGSGSGSDTGSGSGSDTGSGSDMGSGSGGSTDPSMGAHHGGGCSSSGGGAGALTLVAIAGLAVVRRRRDAA